MTTGAGLFATLTGFIASMFVQPDAKAAETEIEQLAREIRALHAKVESLKPQA
jgi:hypothetical protein